MAGFLRRSLRLIASGYYQEDGTPRLSYKERIFRVFKKRTSFIYDDDSTSSDSSDSSDSSESSGEGGNNYFGEYVRDFLNRRTSKDDDTDSDSIPLLVQDNCTQTRSRQDYVVPEAHTTKKKWCSYLWRKICSFFLMLLLIFGVSEYCANNNIQQKFQLLEKNFAIWTDRMPNFALESQGARVIADLSSDTHWTKERTWNILDILTYNWYSEKKHRTVIQGRPSLNPGECWPFKGDQGHLFISLSHPVNISHVTLGHITERQSPTGTIPSAPREFSVYGFTTTDDEGVFLGGHVYERDGPAYQTFTMPNPNIGVFGYVKLVIENNWGEKNHTCVYTFKVHGTIPT